MSGSETGGVMTSREQFTLDVQRTSVPSQPPAQNVLLGYSADGTAVYSGSGVGGGGSAPAATTVSHNVNVNSGGTVKRKRGRPRKYGPNGAMTLSLTPAPLPATVPQSAGTFSPPPPPPPSVPLVGGGGSDSHSSLKKGRGRPPGSSKMQQTEALGSSGVGFTPHIITVKAGEDVSSKIMSFSQHGPRAVCVLSANGTISNVTLRQAATSGGTATYEGRFDILSLSGSFLLTEVGGQRSRTGGLSVSLAGPDGRVLGGCVAGLLTAASPVQVIVGSFIADSRNETKSANQMEPLSAPPKLTPGGGPTGASSSPSHGTFSESSGGSPLNHSTGAFNNNNPQGISSMPWR